MRNPKNYSDLTPREKSQIVEALDSFIAKASEESGVCPEAVATAAFYRLQRHARWGRNATKTQKDISYRHWDGICQRRTCTDRRPIGRDGAVFHHLTRGVSDQHGPLNLVPQHRDCHDDEHNAIYGSLSKGSPPRKVRKKDD